MRYLNARNTAFGEDRKVYSTVDSTATAGQTVFNVSYDQGRVAVFLNGIRLIPVQDYTYALSGLGTTISLGAGISANDYLELIGFQGINAGNALTEDNFVVGTSSTGSGGSYTNSTTVFPVSSSAGDLVSVWRNGIKLVPTTDFTVNATANTVTLQSASNTSDEITVHVVGILQHSNFVQTTGGTFTGNVAMTGDLTVDTNTLKVDSSGNKVGIGATSGFLGKLHIQEFGSVAGSVSSGADTLVLQNNGGHGGLSVLTNNTSTASLHLGDTDSSSQGGLQYDNNANTLSVLSGGAVKATIDSSGNIGIGTASPQNQLHIKGSGGQYINIESDDGDAFIYIDEDGSDNAGLIFNKSGTEKARLYMAGSDESLRFKTAGTDRVHIDSSGNVEIASGGDLQTSTTGKIKQKGAFMQSSTHQALVLGA